MGFSTISAFFGGLIIICYSLSISQYQEKSDDYGTRDIYGYYDRRLRNYHVKMAISVSILLLGIAEFVIGILAPMCCFLMLPCLGGCCACCEAVPQHQVRIAGREGMGGGGGGGKSLISLGSVNFRFWHY